MNSNPIEDIKGYNFDHIYNEAIGIVDSIENTWQKGKKFNYKLNKDCKIGVQTYSKGSLNNDYWCARVSNFENINNSEKKVYYSKLDKYILGSMQGIENTHTHFEKEYIHELSDFRLFPKNIHQEESDNNLEYNSYIAELTYTFQFPLKTRKFYEIIFIFKKKDYNEGYVVSQCISPSNFENVNTSNSVTGRYTSIEKIEYDSDKSNLKWTMCTCSSPGGLIPEWLTKLSLNKAIAKDVPSFLNWVDKKT